MLLPPNLLLSLPRGDGSVPASRDQELRMWRAGSEDTSGAKELSKVADRQELAHT